MSRLARGPARQVVVLSKASSLHERHSADHHGLRRGQRREANYFPMDGASSPRGQP